MFLSKRFILVTAFAISAFAFLFPAHAQHSEKSFPTIKEAQSFAQSLGPTRNARLTFEEGEEKASGDGASGKAIGDKNTLSITGDGPNAALSSGAKAAGGKSSASASAEEFASKINLLMVLGGILIAGGVAGLFVAPVLRKWFIGAILAGGVLFGLGWIVTGGIALLVALGVIAAIGAACVFVAWKYHLLDDTATRIVKSIGTAPDDLKTAIKVQVDKNTLEKHDSVIDILKKQAGV